jgi:hypothetical protein
VSANSIHIEAAAVTIHESISSLPIHIPTPSNRQTIDEQSDNNDNSDPPNSKLQITPERHPLDSTPSPRTSTPQPESVLSQTSGKTPDCQAIEIENSPIHVPNEHILVLDTQQVNSEETRKDVVDTRPTQGDPKVIPSSQPILDEVDGEMVLLRQTPVAAVKGRRKGQPSPSPSTPVHVKSKSSNKKPKKTVEQVKKPLKSKAINRNMKKLKRNSKAGQNEMVSNSSQRRLRPPRNSKTVATERLKVALLPSEPESGEEREEAGNVNEYQPPKKKEKQTAIELDIPEKNDELAIECSVSVPVHEASSETDGQESDGGGGLKQYSVSAETPVALGLCQGLVEWDDDDDSGLVDEEIGDKRDFSEGYLKEATPHESQRGNKQKQVKRKPKEKQKQKQIAPSAPQSLLEFTRVMFGLQVTLVQ